MFVNTRAMMGEKCLTIDRTQRGVSILEFTLFAPILLILLVGLVDIGVPASRYEIVLEAARQSVQQIAMETAETEQPCAILKGEGKRLVGEYLTQAGLSASDWIVTPEVEWQSEGEYSSQMMTVRVSANPSRTLCFLCSMGVGQIVDIEAESSFALLGSCS